jgi:hypothetical protein
VGLRGYAAKDPLTEFKLEGWVAGQQAGRLGFSRQGQLALALAFALAPALAQLASLSSCPPDSHPSHPTPPPRIALPRRYNLFVDTTAQIRRNVIYNVYVFQPQRMRKTEGDDQQQQQPAASASGAQQQQSGGGKQSSRKKQKAGAA